MPIVQHPMQALANYLPNHCFEPIVQYINYYKVHLTVTKKRKTVLGDYRNANHFTNHKISVNGNLNKYEFLITLLHELAHLLTYEQFKNKVEPHGKEWKENYRILLRHFIDKKIFPTDIELALQKSIINPAATANGESALIIVLRKYNVNQRIGYTTIEQLPNLAFFITENGRVFKKGNKRRKRYECVEVKTGLLYLFSPAAEVKLM